MTAIFSLPGRRLRNVAFQSAAALLLPLLTTACATEASARPSPVDIAIIDRDSGQAMPIHRRDGRAYLAGRPGSRYAIRLVNHSGARAMVVLSVDGVNVITGQTAGWNQGGYVLDAWGTYEIAGWRKSDTAIAAFEFAALRDSYAARTGRPDNVGVIGMAVFLERTAPAVAAQLRDAPEVASAAPAPVAKGETERAFDGAASVEGAQKNRADSRLADKLGTAHGRQEWSVATRTHFDRLSQTPQAVVELAYDSYDNLVAAGIIRPVAGHAGATSFPLSRNATGYVPDPPAR